MLNKRELEQAIKECEEAQGNYQNCEKLATFYTLYDHLYGDPTAYTSYREEIVIGDYGSSEFLMFIRDMDASKVWGIIDELMDTLKVTNPRLYSGVVRKIAED